MLRIIDSQFKIAPEQVVPAFQAAITFYHEVKDDPFFDGAFPPALAETSTLVGFFETLGYLLGFDEARAVDYIDAYEGVPYRGDEYLFAALAPYVTAGSYIETQVGSPAAYYRWEFNGQSLMEFKGDIIYTTHMLVGPRDYTKIDLEKEDQNEAIRYPEYDDPAIFDEPPRA